MPSRAMMKLRTRDGCLFPCGRLRPAEAAESLICGPAGGGANTLTPRRALADGAAFNGVALVAWLTDPFRWACAGISAKVSV